jgi:putative transposase
MMNPPNRHERKPNRARGYDYATPGAYFITACTRNRVPLFGDIVDGVMTLNEFGWIVAEAWKDLPQHYPHIILDDFVIMPNHIHGIIWLHRFYDDGITQNDANCVGTGLRPVLTTDLTELSPPDDPILRHGLPEIMRAFKSFSARRINQLRNRTAVSVWQRSYWDRIIRDQGEFSHIQDYIRTNPSRWSRDTLNPD